MKRGAHGDCVELSLLPHSARSGWEVVRLNYDAHNPQHLQQIEAALTALAKARCTGAGRHAGSTSAGAAS